MEEVDRLDAMIARLLYFARPISLQIESVAVGELCCTVAASWKERALPVIVSCVPAPGLMLDGDRSRLVQILDNLVENAVESAASYSGTQGTVLIEARQEQNAIRISVLDNGAGFEELALKHALDPFFTTRANGTGLVLGLSIASELVQADDGELRLQASPQGGAVVSVCFRFGPQR